MTLIRNARDSDRLLLSLMQTHRSPRSSSTRTLALQKFFLTVRVGAALSFIGVATIFLHRALPVNDATVGFLDLVAILTIATMGGLVEATFASFAAMFCFNFFFLPSVGTLTISDPRNWMALFAFLATSLTANQLSARVKRRTVEAEERSSDVERLYSLSRSLLLMDTSYPIAKQIVQQIALSCGIPEVALYIRNTGETYIAGLEESGIKFSLHEVAVRSSMLKDQEKNLIVTPIRRGGEPIGSVALADGTFSDAALQLLPNLAAIGLERANSQKVVTQAEVARQNEELKPTLLHAIAHEFKTPLTPFKAVTTDLLSGSLHTLAPHQREPISIADESTDRLSKLVSDAIQLARIEGGTFRLNLADHFIASLIQSAIRQMKSMIDDRRSDVILPDSPPRSSWMPA